MKFSIGIPAFKKNFLKDCIESVLQQTYTDFELIIINDCSPENIDIIVSEYEDSRIKYYKNKKNIGAENVVDNWNKCLQKSKGEYFILLGDDDLLHKDYLKEFDILITKHSHCKVFHCRTQIINEKSEIINITSSWPEIETVYDSMWHRMFSARHHFISDFVFESEKLKEIGGFKKNKLAWASDDITFYELAKFQGTAHTQKIVFNYRRSNITISSSSSAILKMTAITEEEDWLNYFLKTNQPKCEHTRNLYSLILQNKHSYFRKKRIETIAYSGIKKKSLLKNIFFWSTNKPKSISYSELIYSYVLAVKKMLNE